MGSDQHQRKISQLLLLSVSVFSFIFSSSIWCSSLVYSFKQLVAHALNKNCIFLLCNGLLVFLARTSGLVHSRSGFDLNDLLQKNIGDGLQTVSIDREEEESASSVETLLENAATTMENREQSPENGEQEEEKMNFNEEQDYKNEDEEVLELNAFEEHVYNEEEDDDDNDDAEGESTEELNKKFEDFIRRMKEEIKTTS